MQRPVPLFLRLLCSSHFNCHRLTNFTLRCKQKNGQSVLMQQCRGIKFHNVYEEFGYKAPYCDEDLENVRHRINTDSVEVLSKYISKPRAASIVANRPFEAVEQLLDLKNFSVKHLESFLKKILDENDEDNANKMKKTSKGGKSQTDLSQYITPKISGLDYEANVHKFVGLSFNLTSLSYVEMTTSNEVLSWSTKKTFQSVKSKSNFLHHKIYDVARALVTEMPKGDVYVWEELPVILPNDPYAGVKVSTHILQSYIVAILNERTDLKENIVHLMKPRVVNSVFGLKVGMERVSVHEKLSQLIDRDKILVKGPLFASINDELWQNFTEVKWKPLREQMATALLIAIAFNHTLKNV